jgi:putative copper export protein
MKLLTDLLTTDYGLMSLASIVFMLGMGVWFRAYFKRHMAEDAKNAGL